MPYGSHLVFAGPLFRFQPTFLARVWNIHWLEGGNKGSDRLSIHPSAPSTRNRCSVDESGTCNGELGCCLDFSVPAEISDLVAVVNLPCCLTSDWSISGKSQDSC